MKVRIIATGEIVEVHLIKHYTCANLKVYAEINGARTWREDEIEIIRNTKYIDWEQRRFELVKAAMQGLATVDDERGGLTIDNIAELSVQIADAVIAKLKEK